MCKEKQKETIKKLYIIYIFNKINFLNKEIK